MGPVLSAGPGKSVRFGLPEKHWSAPDHHHAARMLEAEASEQLGRQVFWLTAPSGLRTAFPHVPGGSTQWPVRFGGLADHSGGPATDLHRFPYSLFAPE